MTVTGAWTSPAAAGPLDLAAGAIVTEGVWDAMVSNFLWLGGTTAAFANFTPTLTQGGGLTLSAATGRYWQIGKLVVATVDITINSSGTGGQGFVLGALPVSSSSRGGIGFGEYGDIGSSINYSITGVAWASATSVQFTSGIAGALFGTSPAVTAASPDVVRFTLVYEAS